MSRDIWTHTATSGYASDMGTSDRPPELLTAPEVARIFRVDVRTIYRWGAEGKITEQRTPGGGIRYIKRSVTDYFNERYVGQT
jgi:Helix-turn-helix domain